MTEVEQQPLAQNGIDLSAAEEYDNSKSRPADIEQDMREMERRKRVEAIMSSKLFREELERIVDSARDGGTSGIIQQLSDIVGIPMSRVGSMFRASSSLLPINDIRGVESMGYAKGEKILRCKLAATFRLLDLYGWTEGLGAQVTARLKVDQEYFLVNPYGLLYNEITASALNKVDMQGQIVEQGTTNFGINKNHFILHSVIHAARPDIRCAIYIGCNSVVAISSVKTGLLPITKDACVLGEVTTYNYTGYLYDEEERNKLVRNLGPNSKVMLLSNHGALCCGETIEEAFFAACHIVRACETQLKLLPIDVDNLILIPEETRKLIYDHARRPPEDLDKKHIISSSTEAQADVEDTAKSPTKIVGTATPKWRVGGAEFEALMRMLDNAGFRTGYIYRHPLVKSEPPKPKNDVELPPAVSSLGYLLEEEELFRQGIWKRGDLRKGGDRSRWLNSPNVYQKVEVLETGTPDPKKITKWVAEGSPTHSTPVRIEDPLQFVPVNTNPREFKRVQQQIKDNRRADKISAGPQSHILEGVTWDEANRIKDANVNSSSDHVVLVGAASKGIIQRGFQHNATVYKAPYAKNPFDCVTDDELNEYKRTVERKKKSIYGEYTDTDFSESEALSSQQTSGAQQPQIKEMTTTKTPTTAAAISQSEPEDISEPQVMRIQTQQAPVRSQPEIVLSDDIQETDILEYNQESNECFVIKTQDFKTNKVNNRKNTNSNKNNTKKKKKNNNSISYYGPLEVDGPNNHLCQKSPTPWQQRPPRNRNQNSKQALINELKDESILFKRQREKNSVAFNEINKETGQYNTEQILCNVEKSTNNGNESNNLPCKTSRNVPTRNGNGNVKISSNDNGNTSSNANIKLTDLISHIDDDIGGELYDDIYPCYTNSLNGNIQQHMNSMSVSSDDYVYECINPKNIHKKSRYCCTPNICAALLRSIGKNSQNLQNDTSRGTANDLIWNIPFCREISYSNSPLSTPEKQSIGVRQSRMDVSPKRFCLRYRRHISTKSQSPYRTVSHFGFNSPQRDPRPDHKHIPLTDDIKKYVPLRRSISYEELFASPRFLEICEHCFEKLVRLKPEFIQNRTKLRNLSECQHSCGIMQTITNSSPPGCIKSYTSGTGIGNKSPSDIVKAHLNGDIVEQHMEDNINTGITAKKSFTLEPLIEMEERVKSGSFLPAKVDKPLIQKSHPINITKSIVDSKVLLPIQHHIAQFERNDNMNSYDITKKSITERISNRELRCLQLGRRANMNNMVDTYTSITEMLEFNNSLNGCNTEAENEPDFTKATEREMVSVMVQTDVVDMINAGTNASLDDTNSDGEWDATITTAEEQNSKQEWLKGISNVMVQPEILDMPNTENNIFANDNNSDTEWEVTITTAEEHNVEQGWPQEIACVMIQTDSLDILNKSNSKSHYTEINTALNYNNCDANREATITTARERNSEKEKPQEVTYSAEQTDPMDVINNVQLLSEKLQTSTISHYTEFNSCLDNYSNNTEKDATHNISDENTESKWPSEVTCSMIQTEPIVIVNKTQSIFGKWPSSDNSRPTKSNSSLYEKSSNAAWVTTLTTGINENVKQKCPQGMTYAMAKPPLRYIMNRSERAKRKLKFQQLWESHASFSKESKPILPANSYKTIEYDVDEEHDMLESKQQQNFKLTSSSLTSTDSSYENAWSIVDEMQGENKHQQNGKLASPSSPTCTSSSYKNAESIINEVHWENEQHQNFKQVPSSLTAIDNSYKNDGSIVDKVRWENEKQRNFKLTFVSLTNTDKNTVATVHEVQGENEQMLNVRQTSPFSPTSTNSSYKNAKSIDDEVQGGNIQRENFELTFPSSPMTTDSQEGNEMEISLDAETFYGQSVISHNLTKDHTKIKIMTDDDLHNIDIFPSTATTTSPLDYKSSLDNFLLYSQPTKEVKKLLSSTPTESIGNCSSSNLIKEFEKIVLDDYKSNSNIGKNFKDALKELQSFQIPVNNSTENIQTVCNNTNNSKEILENDLQQNFTPIEREILEKIQMNQLNKTDEIFDKIEKTVRNRRVPGKLDMVIMDKDICVSSTQSESNAGRKHYNHMLNDCGTSRSLTILNDNVMLAATGNKTLLLKKSECVIQNTKKSYPGNNTIKCTTTNNPPALSKSRNFILENIRNASKPSRCINENNFNRLRGLSNQNQNQASCSLTNLTLSNTAISARPITPMKSDDSINIYSFQSKSIKGAPKFWLSMSNSPANSSAKSLSSSYQRCEQHKETYLKEAKQQNHNIKGKRHMDNMGNGDNYNDKEKTTTVIRPMTLAIATATQVNAEINALREEIHKIQPHVENHTNKVENFGNRISKYARGSAQQE